MKSKQKGNHGNKQSGAGNRSGGNEQPAASQKAETSTSAGSKQSGARGGTPEQHAEAGRQSHKNTRK